MQNEGVSKKFDSILKSINDMKITQNKLINSVNLIRDEKKRRQAVRRY